MTALLAPEVCCADPRKVVRRTLTPVDLVSKAPGLVNLILAEQLVPASRRSWLDLDVEDCSHLARQTEHRIRSTVSRLRNPWTPFPTAWHDVQSGWSGPVVFLEAPLPASLALGDPHSRSPG